MKAVSVKTVEYVAFSLAREKLSFHEPIPGFETRFPGALESCVSVPFQKYGGHFVYRGLIAKAAMLFYLMVKNHPFQNGNKRIAMTTVLVFLYQNEKWLEVDQQELYNFAVWVAGSPSEMKEETVKGIEKFIQKHVIASAA